MASIKNLKKDINYVLGDIIEECYAWELMNPKTDNSKAEAIMDEAIIAFDSLIDMVNAKDIENKKSYYKSVELALEEKATELITKVNKL